MSIILPKFQLKTPSETTLFKDLGKELREFGESVEETLEGFDYTGADPNIVLSRVAALEAWQTAAEGRLADLETAALPYPIGSETVASVGSSGSTKQLTVPLPAGRFTSTPFISISPTSPTGHMQYLDWRISSRSASSFTLEVRNTGSSTRNFSFSWAAIGS